VGDERGLDGDVKGQLLVKNLLALFKHRTVEKVVERCELTIVEGVVPDDPDEDHDTLESRLIIRLHCKLGIVKTHRLSLQQPDSLLSPGIPDSHNESRLTIGPRGVKDIIERFPSSRGAKSDPQLIWTFAEVEVEIKSVETSMDSKGKAQLATELAISTEEFDIYDVYATPITIAFHLKEFNGTVAYAESMALTMDLRFTDPSAPLFIDVQGDEVDTLCVISTSQIHGIPAPAPPQAINGRKRPHNSNGEYDQSDQRSETSRARRPMRAAQRTSTPCSSAPRTQSDARSMPPPSFLPPHVSPVDYGRAARADYLEGSGLEDTSYGREQSPLFYPLSQMSATEAEQVRASGLGIENMDFNEFNDMLEGDGEEVGIDFRGSQMADTNEYEGVSNGAVQNNPSHDRDRESLEIIEDVEIGPTQGSDGTNGKKGFQPLFED